MKTSHGRVRSYGYARWTSRDAARMAEVKRRTEILVAAQVKAELRELGVPDDAGERIVELMRGVDE